MIGRIGRALTLSAILVAVCVAAEAPASHGGNFILVVNNLADSGDASLADPRCDVDMNMINGDNCSLRAAIEQTNFTPGADVVNFNAAGGGPKTISPTMPLPEITDEVIINAATQPGCVIYPCIELDGSMVPDLPQTVEPGLVINGPGGTTIRGFIINSFLANHAIDIEAGDGNTIAGNYIGTNAAGTAADANGSGISILSADNVIGGTTEADRNVVSGNTSLGIGVAVPAASNNIIQGNYVGLNAAGTAAVPNGSAGVGSDGTNTMIGGATPGARNVISGNNFLGVTITGDDSSFAGNYVGTNAAGDAAVPNTLDGVFVGNVTGVTIGGSTAGARNVISGNLLNGVRIDGTDLPVVDTVIQGNYIGTDATGTADLGNGSSALRVEKATNTIIGGTAPGARNVISGNAEGILSLESDGTTIQGNYVGTDATGMSAIPNGNRAVNFFNDNNGLLGGQTAAARNIISGNGPTFDGVYIGDSTSVDVIGNWVGLAADGESPLGNARDGIQINTMNTDILVEANVSVANGSAGIGVYFSDGVEVLDNLVGVTPAGDPMGNGDVGIRLWGGTGHTVGNTTGGGNTVAYNGADGIEVNGGQDDDRSRVVGAGGPVPALEHTIRGNSIHSNTGIGINNLNGGNTELTPPVLAAAPFMITGTACANCIIDVYSDDDAEGRIYEGTTVADGGGTFTFSEPMAGPFTTATATDGDGNTSEFSNAVVTPEAPTPSPTPEPTPTATPTPVPSETAPPTSTTGPTATPVLTPTPAASETPSPEGTQGDTDCDKDADSVDALFVLRDVAGFEPSKCIVQGDVDCDEDRDSVDALGILRFVAALPPLAQQEPCADVGTPL